MNCEEAMERIKDQLTGDLDGSAVGALRGHVAGCADCAAEAAVLQALWDGLGGDAGDTPSAALRRRFDELLRREIALERAAERSSGIHGAVERFAPASSSGRGRLAPRPSADRSLRRAALSLALAAALAVALGAGIYLGSANASRRSAEDLAVLRDEIRSLRSSVALALLSESSASERLSGVAYGREIQTEDGRVADALFETLLADPNVNVRLAALDALRQVATSPEHRARLLASIRVQDSPLVQISAIDLLLEAAPAAVPADAAAARSDVASLATDPALDEVVRGYLIDRLERSAQ